MDRSVIFHRTTLPALGLLSILLGSCEMLGGSTEEGNTGQGGSSDQGNAVQVRVLDRFGNLLPYASLEILPEGWASLELPDSTRQSKSQIRANDRGEATFRLAAGRYSLQGHSEHLASLFTLQVSGDQHLDIVLRPASDVMATIATTGIDTLFVPGTRLFGVVQQDGSFRIDSIPKGANILKSRDGRTLHLDTAGSGFVREYRASLSLGNTVTPVPDTLIPKYFATLSGPLSLEPTRPTGVLESWVPDTVRVSGDTIWISSLVRACDALPNDGLAAWWHAESLEVFKRPCPTPGGEPVRHRFHQSPRTGIWTVGTLQPFGYTWEMP